MPVLRALLRPLAVASALLAAPAALTSQTAPSDPRAVAVIDRAITRMGGEAALRGIRTLRMDVLTQWQRTHFADHPYADQPSFERNVELRDYTTNAWRNTRTFIPNGSTVDIVRDTVGGRSITTPNGGAMLMPLNLAYVDERRELFAFAPERTLLLAREAGGLKLLADTSIDGLAHARVGGAVDGFPATWFLRRSDGLLAMVRFRADETNDFGLAMWGQMDVETWFSMWAPTPQGALIPRQRDVRRVGRPYKRMTVLTVAANVAAPSDSFAIADSVVSKYFATEQRPMWDAPLDSAKLIENDFASIPPFLGVSGAVRVGGQWVLLESGQRDGAAAKLAQWFARTTPESPLAAAVVTNIGPSNGGAKWFAEQKKPVFAAPGAVPVLRQVVSATAMPRISVVSTSRWVKVGSDSLWLERVDTPDGHGAMVVYVPTLKWIYGVSVIGRPAAKAEQDAVIARLRARGFAVEWMATSRALRVPLPKP
ncbi:MAG: hypothetical protein ACKVS7_06800 [Gemmatimonadaceae bacterium]